MDTANVQRETRYASDKYETISLSADESSAVYESNNRLLHDELDHLTVCLASTYKRWRLIDDCVARDLLVAARYVLKAGRGFDEIARRRSLEAFHGV